MSTKSPIRILIAGGGTGGHVLPAIAVIEELRSRNLEHRLLWVGSKNGVERRLSSEHDVPFVSIPTGKLRRYFSVQNIVDAGRVPLGIGAGFWQVRKFAPDVIFSTGGAVSVPTLVLGHRLAPVLTHEQTAQVGLANRTAARFARTFAVGYEAAAVIARQHHSNVVITGNPVRSSLSGGNRERGFERYGFDPSLPVLYVTGGARGASPINQRIGSLLPELLDHVQVIHQAGPASANDDVARLQEQRASWLDKHRARYVVTDFVGPELRDIYAMTDLVLARSGAGTVAELAYIGLPSVLIPLPGTWGDEQTRNAAVLADVDAAVVIPQPQASPERLRQELLELLRDPERRQRMSLAARTIARPNAASLIVDELLSLV